jgi:flagellar protein FliS
MTKTMDSTKTTELLENNNNRKVNVKTQKFVKNLVETASPAKLIGILYDGALQWLQMAKKELKAQQETRPPNWSDFAYYTKMASKIVDHLQDSLDTEASQELADRLYALYDFIKESIMKGSVSKNADELDVAIRFINELKDSWSELIKQNELDKSL